MAKKTALNVVSGFASQAALNAEFEEIAEHLNDKVLYRDNPDGEPNIMQNELDMNSNPIANLGAPQNPTSAARLQDVTGTGSITIGRTVYTSIASLRLSDPTQEQNVFLSGHSTEGDGGEGDFYWDSASTASDNGGTIIKVTAVTTGRWVRLYSGPVDIKWFGAVVGTTDYTTEIDAAITAAAAAGTVISADGGVFISDRATQVNYIGTAEFQTTSFTPNNKFISLESGDTDKTTRNLSCVIRNSFNVDSVNLSSATAANPVVVTTAAAHGFSNGAVVYISGITSGMTQISENYYVVANVTSTTFELTDEDGSNINGTAFTAGASNGAVKSIAGWDYIDDATHAPNGFNTISVTGTPPRALVLDYNFTASKVSSLVATQDEVYIQDNVMIGASVGTTSATYYVYQDLIGYIDLAVDPEQVHTPEFYGPRPIAVDNGDGTLTITHNSSGKQEAPVISMSTAQTGSAITSYDFIPKLYKFNDTTNDNFTISFHDKLESKVVHASGSWTITTEYPTVASPTVTAFSTYLQLDYSSDIGETFASCNVSAIYAAAGNGPYIYSILSLGAGIVRIVIQDAGTGVVVDPRETGSGGAADDDMQFYFETNRVRMPIPDVGVVGFHRHGVIVNPKYLVNDSGNFWIHGEMEI